MTRNGEPQPSFQLLFESVPGAYLALQPNAPYTVIAVSDAFLRLVDSSHEALVGHPPEAILASAQPGTALSEALAHVAKAGQPAQGYTLAACSRDQARRLRLRITPVDDRDGNRACLMLTADAVEAVAHGAPVSADDVPAHALGATTGNVLVAEPDETARRTLSALLEDAGCRVTAVADCEVALATLQQTPPDLVLLGANLAQPGCLELVTLLRSETRTRSLPVLLLATHAEEDAHLEALAAGADDLLLTPVAPRELIARVQSQLALGRLRRHADAHRERLFQAFQDAPAAVAVLHGPHHQFELANHTYLRLVGKRNLLGQKIRSALPELSGQGFFESLDRVYATGEPVIGKEVPVHWGRDDLPDVLLNFVFQPLPDPEGGVEGVLVFAFDVTDLVRARQRMEALADEAQLATRRKDEFLAMLAHELRNPLAGLTTALGLLERPSTDAARTARLRELCHQQVGTLVRLVDDLLDVSRITRGKIALRKGPVDFTTVIQNAVQSTRGTLEDRQHALAMDIAAGPYRLLADPTRLEQVITNLLTNAIKYTPAGGRIGVELVRELRDERPWAVLRISDTGQGISADALPHIFDLFVQADITLDRTRGGLGIGLTLVRRLVEMHGGRVAAESAGRGKGSTFSVCLPLDDSAQEGPQAAPQRPAGSATDRRRVLLIEDNDAARETLRELLQELGHQVEVAASGTEGLAKLEQSLPEVAIVDIGLPGLDGFEVAQRTRRLPGGRAVRLIALSGYSGPDIQRKAAAAGFDQQLVKPVDVLELPAIIAGAGKHEAVAE